MNRRMMHMVNIFIAMVWLVNGMFCKVIGLVPRHEQIVAKILQTNQSHNITILIGVAETLMALWIILRIYHRINAIVQIIVIATMNTIEIFLVPDLLLWGKLNALFAFLFILLIYYNEFHLHRKLAVPA